ncbi:tyrosine-type recombinase/integrase [Nitrosomonas ureae]|uniref:Integrase n=1 Tax=Nitrosomonas ureae TaxID=44577 RepID=A0A1H2HK28_9PROT|nr:site-specific integrase [Nitrosomonas ureae]ALQ51148.1 integrase [Nitrosomonas ureae]SDU32195.1 Integrase [Nitrosomonas ureae]
MPKQARELSALDIKRLTKPGHHAAGGVSGLLLQITGTGTKSWILRTIVGAKRRDIGLGGFPDITLAQARINARELKAQIRLGVDPVEQRKAVKAALIASNGKLISFADAAYKFLTIKRSEFKNAKHAAQWQTTLETYAFPVIGSMRVDSVELPHIVQVLEPLWITKTETATRVRGRIESVLTWAKVSGYRTGENPARWKDNLDGVLPKPGKLKKVQHHKAVPWKSAASFMVQLRKCEGTAAKALEFLILTATRSGEVRGALWQEINLNERVWTIPAERMKADKEHVIPLCVDAINLLNQLPRFENNDLVFPAARGGQLSDMTLSAVMRRMKIDATPHGFRSTFRDWCSESTNYPHEVAEMALAHTIASGVEKAYRRGDLLAKRTRLMDDWCKYLNTQTLQGVVIPIREIV